jgi:Icc-related predicted phosphoesterase
MRILVISDLHGDLGSARRAIDAFEPDLLLCCGDWGDPNEVSEDELATFPARLPVLTTFGNHDPLALLDKLRNQDGTPVRMGQGEVREVAGLRIAAIGGIWAKSHRLPHYVTDEDVAGWASEIASGGAVDILMTHGCPVGLADLTPKGTHGGQRCFLEAFRTIAPRVHLCGHLHVAQERTMKDGSKVFNVGATPDGSVAIIEAKAGAMEATLEQIPPAPSGD